MLVKICIFVLWIHILIKRKVEFRPILFVFYFSDGPHAPQPITCQLGSCALELTGAARASPGW